jgi:hypothetical protein
MFKFEKLLEFKNCLNLKIARIEKKFKAENCQMQKVVQIKKVQI